MKINRVIIGAEVHIELKTLSKMFCSCPADHFSKEPNTQTCPVCLGLPGALPVPNKKAIDSVILFGLAINGEIQKDSHFDRKNYFYPDLPKGYQISQYDDPFIKNGSLELNSGRAIKIRRAHLEEDTAKLLHETVDKESVTLVDFNRSGVPLMEVVSDPDLESSDEAKEYLEKIRQIVIFLGISDAEMEKGSLRCEPNVNLEIEDSGKLFYTPIVEIKNINSFRFAKKAIDFEIERQFKDFQENKIEKKDGNKQTRGWDESKGVTVLQRTKEEASDYRYFPEPDIPPIEWSEENITEFKKVFLQFQLPSVIKKKYINEFGLSGYQADILTRDPQSVKYFDEAVKIGRELKLNPVEIANILLNLRDKGEKSPSELIAFIQESKTVVTTDDSTIDKKILELLKQNPDVVASFEQGRPQALGMIVGLIKKEFGAVITIDRIINLIKSKV